MVAQYADVIAPFRLLQVKHSRDSGNVQRLDLEKELNKMGVTLSTKYRLQQAVTSVLYWMWPKHRAGTF
jgi:hypothetical protein